jgi:hypothetical protein
LEAFFVDFVLAAWHTLNYETNPRLSQNMDVDFKTT